MQRLYKPHSSGYEQDSGIAKQAESPRPAFAGHIRNCLGRQAASMLDENRPLTTGDWLLTLFQGVPHVWGSI